MAVSSSSLTLALFVSVPTRVESTSPLRGRLICKLILALAKCRDVLSVLVPSLSLEGGVCAGPFAVVVAVATDVPIVANIVVANFHRFIFAFFQVAKVDKASVFLAILNRCCRVKNVVFDFGSFVVVIVDWSKSLWIVVEGSGRWCWTGSIELRSVGATVVAWNFWFHCKDDIFCPGWWLGYKREGVNRI